MVIFNKHARLRFGLVIMVIAVLITGLQVVSGCSPAAESDTGQTSGSGSQQSLPPAPVIGREAPDFTLEDLDGNSIRLNDLRGKVVFLNFWATWCPPCRAEMPDIEEIYQQYKDQDVVILGIDIQESPNKVRSFVKDGGYTWTMLLDETAVAANLYNVRAIPTSYFIDREGIIKAISIGGMSSATIKAKLADAMK